MVRDSSLDWLRDPLLICWLIATLLIAMFSAATGTSGVFVLLQAAIFLAALAAWKVLKPLSPLVALVVMLTLAKNFLISQPLKILFWQAADSNLMEPAATAAAILAAACGAIAAGVFWALAVRPLRLNGMLERSLEQVDLGAAAKVLIGAGLASRFLWCVLHAPLAVFAYGSFLVFFGVVLRIRLVRQQHPERIFDRFSALALAAFSLMGFAQGSRTEIMLALFGFLPAIYLGLRRWPDRRLLLAGMIVLIPLVSIISPVVDYSRRMGAGTYNHPDFALVGSEFMQTMGDLIADPAHTLNDVYAYDAQMSQSDKISRRVYYGDPKGLLDRFTPSQIDDLVAVGVYQRMPLSHVLSYVKALAPTFGAGRDNTVGQLELESAVARLDAQRSATGTQVSFANFGLAGVFFYMGGLAGVFFGFLATTAVLFALSGWLFGARNPLLALAWFPIWMTALADGNLMNLLVTTVHVTIVVAGSVILVFVGSQMYGWGRRRPVAYGPPSAGRPSRGGLGGPAGVGSARALSRPR